MKTVRATLSRLIGALEEIGHREDGALACGDGLTFLELQSRALPLVERITTLAAEKSALDGALLARGRALLATRHERLGRLQKQLSSIRDELGLIDQARLRAKAFRPAYAQRSSISQNPAFSAQG